MFKNFYLFFITFIVAFCSIVYELIFSQILTIVYGGTVIRYSITIGLFLFSLGVGSFLYNYLNFKGDKKLFLIVEISLSIIGLMGPFLIIILNSLNSDFLINSFFQELFFYISHLPIILVGILSGLEIPILSNLVQKRKNSFSEVLGFDYFGSLIGTMLYSLYFYPELGLIITTIIIAFLNLLVSIIFYLKNYKIKKNILFLIILFILFIFFIFILLKSNSIENEIENKFLETQITQKYWNFNAPVTKVEVLDHFNTKYQEVIRYNLEFYRESYNPFPKNDSCLNLDSHIQLCESWIDSYHKGLVEVPLSFFNTKKIENLNVLILGGGDWIAVNYLKKFNMNIDLVDIDKEFTDYTKKNKYFIKYNNYSFNYKNLNFINEDAFYFLKNNNKKYDLIILDLPGAENEKLLHLYSNEFYKLLLKNLKKNSFIVSWTYPDNLFPEFNKIYLNTVSKAGFSYYLKYNSYNKIKNITYPIEYYILLTNSKDKKYLKEISFKNPNLKYPTKFRTKYQNLSWNKLLYNNSIKPNSIFKPNLDIIIKKNKKVKNPLNNINKI